MFARLRRPGNVALAALLAAGALAISCAQRAVRGAEAPDVWICGESLKVSPTQAPITKSTVWNSDNRTITLHAGRQEYVGFQVVLRGGSGAEKATVSVSALRSTDGHELAAGNIDLYREHYLQVSVPSQWDSDAPVPETAAGEYPVQMVPLRDPTPGRSLEVAAGRNQPVWVDVYVPENQAPGEYEGEVTVTTGDKPARTLKTHLTVWNFTLPRATHLKTYLPTGPQNLRWAFGLRKDQKQELRDLEDRFFQMAHQHRLNFNPSTGEDEAEEWGGRYRGYLDGSAFKERLGAGVGQNLMVIGTDSDSPNEIRKYVESTLAWWRGEKFPADLVYSVYDEPKGEQQFAEVTARAKAVRAADPKLPILLTTDKPQSVEPGLIDVWGELPAADVPAHQNDRERVWAVNHGYAGAPFVDTPGYAGRSQAWMAWKMKLDGWYFWDCCYWTDRQNIIGPDKKRLPTKTIDTSAAQYLTDTWANPLTFDQKRNPNRKYWIRINGDGVLFYPGAPAGLQEPLASFTMKSLRRGLQDYEYLWLLRSRGQSPDDVVARVVEAPEKWSRDPEAWDQARLELGKRLSAAAQ